VKLPVVSMGKFAIRGLDVHVQRLPFEDGDEVVLILKVSADAASGRSYPESVTMRERIPRGIAPGGVESFIRYVVRKLVAHEVDEWLSFDGVRRDPHAPENER
jgi:hypothetical protein